MPCLYKEIYLPPEFVANLIAKPRPGAVLLVATDWQNYAQHILGLLSNNPDLINTASEYAEKSGDRPQIVGRYL